MVASMSFAACGHLLIAGGEAVVLIFLEEVGVHPRMPPAKAMIRKVANVIPCIALE